MRGVEEEDKPQQEQKTGLNFSKIWTMLFYFLMFMLVRSVVVYAVDYACLYLWDKNLPAWLDSFLFVRDPAAWEEGADFAFTGNQTALKSILGFIGGALAIQADAVQVIKTIAEENKLRYLRKEGGKSYLLLAGATIGSALGLNLALELTGVVDKVAAYQAVVADQYSAHFLLGLISTGIVAPIAEELLFRGIIHNVLKRVMTTQVALFFSSAFFGLYHMNFVSGVYAFLMGCLIAYAYEYFGDFKMAVAVHAGANILVYSLTYTPIVTSGFVSWPVCLVFAVLAIGCLQAMKRKKDVF